MKPNIHPALDKKDTVIISLRTVPLSLHRALKIEAMDKGISLENHIVNLLAKAVK